MSIPRFKRIPINWEKLKNCIYEQGYNMNSIAKEIGVSPGVFARANEDGLMNPLIVLEIRKYVDFEISSVMKEPVIERICNGRSTSGRIGIDWLFLEREAKKKRYSLRQLSIKLGRSNSYLGSCKREGGISEDILIQIGELLDLDYHSFIKTTSYGRWNLRREIVSMINEVDYLSHSND